MAKRPRTQRATRLRKGDVFRGFTTNMRGIHTIIVLEDEPDEKGHARCVPVCNFTSSNVPLGEYAIDVSKYQLPEHWFESKKPETWIRCNCIDCVKATKYDRMAVVGNILDCCPELMEEVCRMTVGCEISERLSQVCECTYEEIKEEYESRGEFPDKCDCAVEVEN